MKRLSVIIMFVIGISLVSHFQGVGQAQPKNENNDKEKKPVTKAKSLAVAEMFRKEIETKGLQERVKFKIAAAYLSNVLNGELVILVDKEAFLADLGADAPDPSEEEVSLPAVPKMPVGMALRLLLSQIGKGQATYVIRNGYVTITPRKYATAEAVLHVGFVTTSFDLRPLKLVLESLADDTGADINLDPNVGKKAEFPITAKFGNASLESALVTVTEMAELKYVVLGQSVFVTTPDRAKLVQKEEQDRAKKRTILEKTLFRVYRLEAAS